MNNKILFFLFLIFISYNPHLYSQNTFSAKVVYDVKVNPVDRERYLKKQRPDLEKNKSDKKIKWLINSQDAIYNNTLDIKATLSLKDGISRYVVDKAMKSDTESEMTYNIMKSYAGGEHIY